MFGIPSVVDRKDPANGAIRLAVMIAAPILLALTVFAQQFMVGLSSRTFDEAPVDVREDERVEDPGIAPFTLEAKSILKEVFYLENEHLFRDGVRGSGRGSGPDDEGMIIDDLPVLEAIDGLALTRTERLRAAIAAGEVGGVKAARERLATLASEVEPGGELAADLHWIQKIYSEGAAAVTPEAREALIDRHGWFARVALSQGKPPQDLERMALLSGYERLLSMFVGYGIVMVLASLAGVGLAVTALVMLSNGSMTGEFDAPAVGGTVYLESCAIFLLGFSVMVFLQIPFRGAGTAGATVGLSISEVLTWSLLLSAFWPIVRGVSWDAFRIDMGLHSGAGVGREIWIGVLAFAAERPVLWIMDLLTGVIGAIARGGAEESEVSGTAEFPMFESPIGNSWWLVWLGALGSVVWAPVVEELIFRGALYRTLHAKLRWPLTVLLTALAFAMIHPYSLDGMASVFVGGLAFGLLREWRGSLIAGIVCHMLHNGSIELMNLGYLTILDS